MNGKNRLNGFDLDDHDVVDQHVNSITQFDCNSLVHHGKDLLAVHLCAHSLKVISKAFSIRPLEKAWTQSRVDSVSGTQNAVGCFAVYEPWPISVRVRALRVSAFRQQMSV